MSYHKLISYYYTVTLDIDGRPGGTLPDGSPIGGYGTEWYRPGDGEDNLDTTGKSLKGHVCNLSQVVDGFVFILAVKDMQWYMQMMHLPNA